MNTTQLNQITENKEIVPLTAGINKEDHLVIGGCDVVELGKKYGTPLYIIDEDSFVSKCNEYKDSLAKYYDDFIVLYASKAFSCTSLYKIVNNLKLGTDVVSGGELFAALSAGMNKNNIYFHGNNKSYEELDYCIKESAGKIICDNFYELDLINKAATKENKNVDILLRLTPGIECHTHEYIKTGHLDSKFGFTLESFDDVLSKITKEYKNINLIGLHAHIGSQIFELKPFADTIDVLLKYFKIAKDKYNLDLKELNIGGGLGIYYTSKDDPFTVDSWAKTVTDAVKTKCKELDMKLPRLICEPGRSLIGPSGITIYEVGNVKEIPGIRKYVSVDGGMADNPRPITYQSEYVAVAASKMSSSNKEKVTIAGRYCESGDIIIKDIELPTLETGDIIAVLATGAYTYSMSSNYNMVPRASCVLVKDGKADIIIKREEYSDLISKHIIPDRLNS